MEQEEQCKQGNEFSINADSSVSIARVRLMQSHPPSDFSICP